RSGYGGAGSGKSPPRSWSSAAAARAAAAPSAWCGTYHWARPGGPCCTCSPPRWWRASAWAARWRWPRGNQQITAGGF
ncbi:unnamed protein product, partial [Prorocentrum cordatum]